VPPTIKVIADSVSDVPPEIVRQYGITIVPTVVNIGQKSYLDDGRELTRDDFFAMLPNMRQLPTTAACPLGLTRELITRCAMEADHLLLFAAPAHLSSIYNNFRIAAEEAAPDRYTLFDSGQLTMGEGFQVILAAEMAAAGASVEAIAAAVEAMRPRIHIFAALSTLENLRKSGRVNWAMAMAGRLLRIKPMVELTEGNVTSLENIRTFRRAIDRLIALAFEYAPLERLAVLHTSYYDGAEYIREALAPLLPPEQVLVVNVNPSLGTHVGAKGLGLALVTES
jgi:DegV family protein with EDD domain